MKKHYIKLQVKIDLNLIKNNYLKNLYVSKSVILHNFSLIQLTKTQPIFIT